jgi:uncharacterized protein (DUF58 family)
VSDVTLAQRQIFIFPTRYGLFFLVLALLLFIGGINYQNNLMMGFSFLLFSVFCVAILHTFRNLSGLRLRVAGWKPNFAGKEGQVEFHLLAAAKGHLALKLFWQPKAEQKLSLDGGLEARVTLPLALTHRGWNKPGVRLHLESRYPLGLLRTWSLLDMDCACLAWPEPLPGGECPASGGDEEVGLQALGQGSDDFAGLRAYLAGDSLNRIDWKAYARGKGLNVRYFVDPAEGRQWLEWDRLAGLDAEARLSRLCYWALELEAMGRPWGLLLPNDSLAPATGEPHLLKALDMLARFGEVAR